MQHLCMSVEQLKPNSSFLSLHVEKYRPIGAVCHGLVLDLLKNYSCKEHVQLGSAPDFLI